MHGFFFVYLALFIFAIVMLVKFRDKFKASKPYFAISLFIIGLILVIFATPFVDYSVIPSIFYTLQTTERIYIVTAVLFVFAICFLLAHVRFKKAVFIVIIVLFGAQTLISFNFWHEQGSLFENPELRHWQGSDAVKFMQTDDGSLQSQANLYTGANRVAIGEYWTTNMAQCNKTIKQIHDEEIVSNLIYQIKNAAVDCLLKRENDVLPLTNNADISNITRSGSHIDFVINSVGFERDDIAEIELPQAYYLGYKAYGFYGDGSKHWFDVHESANGLVQIDITPNYQGEVYSYFGFSTGTYIGYWITILTLLICGVYLVYFFRKTK